MFKPNDALKKSLEAEPRNRKDIVDALRGYIFADSKFETDNFKCAVEYVLGHGVPANELFAEFDPKIEFLEDKGRWTEDYLKHAMVHLKDNFCRERIQHVYDVAKKLYPAQSKQPEKTQYQQPEKAQPKRSEKGDGKKAGSQQPTHKNKPNTKKTNPKPKTGSCLGSIVGIIPLLALNVLKHLETMWGRAIMGIRMAIKAAHP